MALEMPGLGNLHCGVHFQQRICSCSTLLLVASVLSTNLIHMDHSESARCEEGKQTRVLEHFRKKNRESVEDDLKMCSRTMAVLKKNLDPCPTLWRPSKFTKGLIGNSTSNFFNNYTSLSLINMMC
ncbi:uncharacterized protein GJ701_016493 isoform 1-T1 [Geothlypis trichas]